MAGKVYEYHYSVTGQGSFPIDMLRYDRATPATEADSGLIERALRPGKPETLTIAVIGAKIPTDPRWASFGWTVSPKVERRTRGQ